MKCVFLRNPFKAHLINLLGQSGTVAVRQGACVAQDEACIQVGFSITMIDIGPKVTCQLI